MHSEDLSDKARKALLEICSDISNHVKLSETNYTTHIINELLHFDLIMINNDKITPTNKGLSIWLFDNEDIRIDTMRDQLDTNKAKNNKKGLPRFNIDPTDFCSDNCDNKACNHEKKHIENIKHSDIVSDALRDLESDFKRAGGVRFGKTFNIDANNLKNTKKDGVFTAVFPKKTVRNISKNEAFIMRDLYDSIELVSTHFYKRRVINRLCKDGYIQQFDSCTVLSEDNKSIVTKEGDFVTLTEKGVAWILFGDTDMARVFSSDNDTEDILSYLWSTCNIVSELL